MRINATHKIPCQGCGKRVKHAKTFIRSNLSFCPKCARAYIIGFKMGRIMEEGSND